MFLFTLKKSFFDTWDNLLRVALINFGYLLILGSFFLAGIVLVPTPEITRFILIPVFVLLFAFYTGGASRMVQLMVDYERPGFKDLISGIKENALYSLISGLTGIALGVCAFVVEFYLSQSEAGFHNFIFAVIVFWMMVTVMFSMMYYFPIVNRLEKNVPKIFKKALIIFLDNLGFSLTIGILSIINIALSIVTAGLAPGVTGIMIFHETAIKLRLRKYDWLEEHPETKPKDIPWDDLLEEEQNKVGPRDLKSMIFPWK